MADKKPNLDLTPKGPQVLDLTQQTQKSGPASAEKKPAAGPQSKPSRSEPPRLPKAPRPPRPRGRAARFLIGLIVAGLLIGGVVAYSLVTQNQSQDHLPAASSSSSSSSTPNPVTAITITSPVSGDLFKTGATVTGQAQVNGGVLYWQLSDPAGAAITSGQSSTADPNSKSAYSFPVVFTTSATTGTLQLWGLDSSQARSGLVQVPVKLK